MLTHLRIQNLAIAEALEVEFGPGMNVITGETGAGKSLLVDAIALLLGGRAQPELVRTGASEAVVEGRFAAEELDDRLEALGLPPGEGELVIRRTLARGARGKVTVNGALCTVAMLAQVGRGLVDLATQHEHVALLEPSGHLALLDAFAGNASALEEHRLAFAALACAQRERDRAANAIADRARRVEELGFQVRELEALAPSVGEEVQLAAERKRLANVEKLRAALAAVAELLTGTEVGAVELAGRAQGRLAEALALDPALEPIAQGIRAGFSELDEAARSLARYLRGVEARPDRLGELEDRLEQLRRVARKHGCPADALPERLALLSAELGRLESFEARASDLERAVETARARALETAARISTARRQAASRFSSAVRDALEKLAMPEVGFEVRLETTELGESGLERAELFIAPNPGEPPLPLARIASGGELSRVSLAVKRALAAADPVGSYVFDEVDSGIGGAVADSVGRMLKAVATHRQVLCITHLPQVAAFADRHLVVRKAQHRGRTAVAIAFLDGDQHRQAELARMSAGAAVGEGALAHARALLEGAREPLPQRPHRSAKHARLRAVSAR